MKIEMCEQMVQSWLQHCKQCEIVQTNWMISPLRDIQQSDIDTVGNIMKDIQDKLNQALEAETKRILQQSVDEELDVKPKKTVKKLDIFKKNKAGQFISQCEIDVVGCKLDCGITEKIYLVDSAFHKTGLGYHDAAARVIKKIVRALLVSLIIFGEDVPVTVAFASPKCSPALKENIEKIVEGLRNILLEDARYNNIDIELYFNEKFTEEIYVPLIANLDALNNDNDLFMRAMNLAKLAEEHRVVPGTHRVLATSVAKAAVSTAPAVPSTRAKRGENEKLVLSVIKNVIASGKMTPALVDELRQPSYTKNNFGITKYPLLLKESEFSYYSYERCRFYKKTFKINGENYLVCSQWYNEKIKRLQDWAATL